MNDALERAKAKAGGPSGLAKALGDITSQAISQWKKVPAERARDVERITGISRFELRPDVFGTAESEHSTRPDVQSKAQVAVDTLAEGSR